MSLEISQHIRDEQLLQSIVEYLGCGKYYFHPTRNSGVFFKIWGYYENSYTLFPFGRFATLQGCKRQNYNIKGVKYQDFLDWCKIAEIMKIGGHRTEKGFEEISQIKQGMNKGRQGIDELNIETHLFKFVRIGFVWNNGST